MPLSCSCDYEWMPEPGDWDIDWSVEFDFSKIKTAKRKKCISCRKLIEIGAWCIKYKRYRFPYTEIEARIHGVDWDGFEEPNIKMSLAYHCEKCGEIFLNLRSVGFECIHPTEYMVDLLHDYQHEYAPPKIEKE